MGISEFWLPDMRASKSRRTAAETCGCITWIHTIHTAERDHAMGSCYVLAQYDSTSSHKLQEVPQRMRTVVSKVPVVLIRKLGTPV